MDAYFKEELPTEILKKFEQEEQKKAEKNKIYIHIGKDIKIEISDTEYDNIKAQYKEVGDSGFKDRLMGVTS